MIGHDMSLMSRRLDRQRSEVAVETLRLRFDVPPMPFARALVRSRLSRMAA